MAVNEQLLLPGLNVEVCENEKYEWSSKNGNPQFLVANSHVFAGHWLVLSCVIRTDAQTKDAFKIYQDTGVGWSESSAITLFPDNKGHIRHIWKCLSNTRAIRIDPSERSGPFSVASFSIEAVTNLNTRVMPKRSEGVLQALVAGHGGKVSDKWSIYITEYERLFAAYRKLPIRLLEIGVQNGGSLEIWRHYFAHAQRVVGCDINPRCAELQFDDPTIAIVVGNANTDDAQQQILTHSANFDLIVDDGSHQSSDIVSAFARYFPHLNDGGLYIAEDLHCSYWHDYEGGIFQPHSAIAFLKRLADIVNHEHWGVNRDRLTIFKGFGDLHNAEMDEATLAHIHSIEFINSMCVIKKAFPEENGLGKRVVVGQSAFVEENLLQLNGHGSAPQNQSGNQWSNREISPEEELPAMVQEIARLNRFISEKTEAGERAQQAVQIGIERLDSVRQTLATELQHATEREEANARDMYQIQLAHEQHLEDERRQFALRSQNSLDQLTQERQRHDNDLRLTAEREHKFSQQLQRLETSHAQRIEKQNCEWMTREQRFQDQLTTAQDQLTQARQHHEDNLRAIAEREQEFLRQIQRLEISHAQWIEKQNCEWIERERNFLDQLARDRQLHEFDLREASERGKALALELLGAQEMHAHSAERHSGQFAALEKKHAGQLADFHEQLESQLRDGAKRELVLGAQIQAGHLELQALTVRWLDVEGDLRNRFAHANNELAAIRASYFWRLMSLFRRLVPSFTDREITVPTTNLLGNIDGKTPIVQDTASHGTEAESLVFERDESHSKSNMISSDPKRITKTLKELLSYDGEQFVLCAYQTVLGREPEIEGMHFYVASERAGISKIEILTQMRMSREGRSTKTYVCGLERAIKLHRTMKLPLLGSLLRAFGRADLESDSGRSPDASATTSFPGVIIREMKGFHSDGEFSAFEENPQLVLGLSGDALTATRATIELEVESADGQLLDSRIYLGSGEADVITPLLSNGARFFIVVLPAFLHSFRIDLTLCRAGARITRLSARPIDAAELAAICGGEYDVSLPTPRGFDYNSLREFAVSETHRLNRQVARQSSIGVLSSGGEIQSCVVGRITGVVWDHAAPTPPVIEFLIDGRLVASTTAQPPFTDPTKRDLPVGSRGFEIQFPAAAACTTVIVHARIQREGIPLTGSPFQIGPLSRPLTPIDIRRNANCADVEHRLAGKRKAVDLNGPLISVLTPVYNVKEIWLRRMAGSILGQTYQNWELCLVDDGSTDAAVREVLNDIAVWDQRIKVKYRGKNGGISAATNDALAMAEGEYVALVDNDDMLTCDALEAMVEAIVSNDAPDWLYSDECKIDEDDRASQLFAKPDWSPFMLLNYMYTGHLSLYRSELVRSVGGFRSAYDFSQDYDLALRIADVTRRVVHVEKYLYGWRMIAGSGAQGDKPEARKSNIAALQDAVDRRGWAGMAVALPAANRVVRDLSGAKARFSIVVPSDNARNIQITIESILGTSTYRDFEIIVVTNSKIIRELEFRPDNKSIVWNAYDKPFNFSDKCNAGAAVATGDYIAFFNDDVRVISSDWMECLLEYLTLEHVGAVGPKLLYENGNIQHAGMVTGVRRLVGTAFHAYPGDTDVHFNMAQCVRDVSLICGALLAMPIKLFRALGGYDSTNAPISHSDVDLCLRVREAGYACLYTPYATLIHIGHASLAEEEIKVKTTAARRKDKHDIFLLKRFCMMISRDPFFTPAMRDLIYLDSQEDFLVGATHINRVGKGPDILIISHELTNSGAPRVVYDMVEALIGAGCFVVVAAPSDGPMRSKLEVLGVPVLVDETLFRGDPWMTEFARNFEKVIVNTIIGWPSVKQLQDEVQTYWYIHEAALIDHIADLQPAFRDFLPRARNVFAVSGRAGEYLSKYGVMFRTLETGVEDLGTTFLPLTLNGANVKIGLFGSFEPRKGQDIAAHAFSLLAQNLRETAELHFYGRSLDTVFETSVRAQYRECPNIFFNGEAHHPEYFDRLSEMDVVVVPSRDDPLPLVALDAMSFGKTILCSHTTGTAWHVVHGESGYITEGNSAEELRDLFALMIADEGARRAVRPGARAVFEAMFTIEAFQRRLFDGIALNASIN